MTWPEFSPAYLSPGGAYIRIWRPGSGLSVELPALLIRERNSGEVVAFGDEAQAMEGKLPETLEAVHPFWGDEIQDREALRFLFAEAMKLDRSRLGKKNGESWWQRYTLIQSSTASPLHTRWLLTTCQEVWPIPWKTLSEIAILENHQSRSQVWGVLDLGFSGARAILISAGQVVASKSDNNLGLATFCRQLIAEEDDRHHLRFADDVFYGQEWFVQQAAFSRQSGKPVFSTLHKDVFQKISGEYLVAVAQLLQSVMSAADREVLTHLPTQGWLVVGGGAALPGLESIAQQLSVPLHLHPHPRYASVRGGKS